MAKTPFTKARLDRLIYLLLEIEEATYTNGRGTIRVTAKDARFIRPIVEALMERERTEAPRG